MKWHIYVSKFCRQEYPNDKQARRNLYNWYILDAPWSWWSRAISEEEKEKIISEFI